MAYPNPVSDFLTLKIQRDKLEGLYYKLMDINGKILEVKVIEKNETIITLQEYLPNTYFLLIVYNNQEIKSFKIIKN
jgi:hypothetical protein